MTQGKWSRLSPTQKTDVWSRWKGRADAARNWAFTASGITRFEVCYCLAAASLPSRHASPSGVTRSDRRCISIHERPAEAEDRAIPGHWEGDLLSGARNSYIATLVERHSRFVMLIKVPSKETEAVVAALSQPVRKLPATAGGYWLTSTA